MIPAALLLAGVLCGQARAGLVGRGTFDGVDYSVFAATNVPTAVYHLFGSPLDAFPLVKLQLANNSDLPRSVSAHARIPGFTPLIMTGDNLPPLAPGEKRTVPLTPPLSPEKYALFTRPRPADLIVELSIGQSAMAFAAKMLFQPRDRFPWQLEDAEGLRTGVASQPVLFYSLLASWVDQHFFEWEDVLKEASVRRGSLPGYADPDTFSQVRAVYEAVRKRYAPKYVSSDVSLDRYQVIRHPLQVESAPNQNCIDGVILYASILLRAGLDPLIVATPRHALLGWRVREGSDEIEVLDTTAPGGFPRAVAAAHRYLEGRLDAEARKRLKLDPSGCTEIAAPASPSDSVYIVDIKRLQERGFFPMPAVVEQGARSQEERAILDTLDRWQVAWEMLDLPAYMDQYAVRDFHAMIGGTRLTAAVAWEDFRRYKESLFRDVYKTVSIERTATRIHRSGADRAAAYFFQRFAGVKKDGQVYIDVGYKQLELIRADGVWRISGEEWKR